MYEFFESLSQKNVSLSTYLSNNNESGNSTHIGITVKNLINLIHGEVNSLTVTKEEVQDAINTELQPSNGLVLANKMEQYYKIKREIFVID